MAAVVTGRLPGLLDHPKTPSALSLELQGLRADNGLYLHPVTSREQQLSLADSAYALTVGKLAGRQPEPVWDAPGTAEALSAEVGPDSVWARWYVYQLEEATGARAPGFDYAPIAETYREGGYLEDATLPAADPAAQLAVTAAGLEAAMARGVQLPAAARDRITAWAESWSGRIDNPYQACNLGRIAIALGRPAPPAAAAAAAHWWRTKGSRLKELTSAEDVMDVYGYLCAAPGDATAETATHLRELLAPYLARTEDAFIAYHLAHAWRAAGGAPQRLAAAADALADHRQGNGLVNAQITEVGTLDNAYAVTEIRKAARQDQTDDGLAQSVSTHLREHAKDLDTRALAQAALIQLRTGHPDPAVQHDAARALAREAPAAVTADSVLGWAEWHRLAEQLDALKTAPTITPWPAGDPEGRYKTWLLLATVAAAEKTTVPETMRAEIDRIPGVLATRATELSMRELRAGVQALTNFGARERIPAEPVRTALGALRGCPRLPGLYRGQPSEPTCDLNATADAYWLQALLTP